MEKFDLKQITENNADSIVLGCTHYNFIYDQLKTLKLPIFDSIDGVSKQIRLLTYNTSKNLGNTIIFTTSENKKLQSIYINYYNKLLNQ